MSAGAAGGVCRRRDASRLQSRAVRPPRRSSPPDRRRNAGRPGSRQPRSRLAKPVPSVPFPAEADGLELVAVPAADEASPGTAIPVQSAVSRARPVVAVEITPITFIQARWGSAGLTNWLPGISADSEQVGVAGYSRALLLPIAMRPRLGVPPAGQHGRVVGEPRYHSRSAPRPRYRWLKPQFIRVTMSIPGTAEEFVMRLICGLTLPRPSR